MKKILRYLFLVIGFTGLVFAQQTKLKKISFVPHWSPQAQFAGYYVAFEKGIYKKYGIDLQIITGGPKVYSSKLLENGQADFASLWLTNAIQLRDKGVKVVNLAQLINRSALMLITKKSSNIKMPQDMNGKKIGIWGGDFEIQPMAFFKKFNLDVKVIHQGNSINLFFLDGIDVTTAMWYNEYHTIINSGINEDELVTFFFSDYGLNFPEEGIYCLENTLRNDPEVCKNFVLATLEGWQYSFNNLEETLQIIAHYVAKAALPFNSAHQKWMLSRMKDLIFPSGSIKNFEKLSKENYMLVGKKLMESSLIKNIPDYENFYKPVEP